MTIYNALYEQLEGSPVEPWLKTLPQAVEAAFERGHGDLEKWQAAVGALPSIKPSSIDLSARCVRIGTASDLDAAAAVEIERQLRILHPWRKGPYSIFGIDIDTEWRSDWKWARLQKQISPLKGRYVLDVGCGNGYHAWRMAGEEAALVAGIDPTMLFVQQYQALQQYMPHVPVYVLPLGIEALPRALNGFDTVFSMGVLYHRRSPIDHLYELRSLLRSGGELVLETLVVEGGQNTVMVPAGRYAKMRNVWFIPSVLALEAWLTRCGFKHIRLVDRAVTTIEEQRSTAWMTFDSLPDFLTPNNRSLTVEGLPAPMRAVMVAEAP